MTAATPSLIGLRAAAGQLLTRERRRPLRHGLVVAGAAASLLVGWRSWQGPAIDAHAYWINRPPVSYEATPGVDGAYLYSPAFAQLLSPLTALPWELFLALWLAAMLLVLGWLVGPLLLLPAVVLTTNEITYANIHFFLAAAIVIGFRHPWSWSLVLLTKVTPGVGVAWFLARREWRSLAIALGATAAIAAISFALEPAGWAAWLQMLMSSAGGAGHAAAVPGPLWLRLLVALALTLWAGRTDRAWLVPVAAFIALPHGTIGTAILVGVVPLLRGRLLRSGRDATGARAY
jgi:hypothetical protein